MVSSSLNSGGSGIARSFRFTEVRMAPAVTRNDSLWVVWSFHTVDWHDLAFFCNVSLLLLSFNLKASSAFVAEELCRGVRLTLLHFFLWGTFSEAISSRCFTRTSSAGSLLFTKSSSLLACVWFLLAIRLPFAKWIFRFNSRSCFASSSSESAGFSTSLNATGGMLARRSWISFEVKSCDLRASLTAWSLFSWKQNEICNLFYYLCITFVVSLVFTKNMFGGWFVTSLS